MTYTQLRDSILNNFATPDYIKDLVRTLDTKDPVDAMHYIKMMSGLVDLMVDEAGGIECVGEAS